MYRVRTLILVATLVAVAPVAAAQDSRTGALPTVAVMRFNNGATGAAQAELEPLRGGIADILVSELSANPRIRVIERDELDRLVAEQNLGAEGRVDKGTAVRVGRLLGVHHMIFGGYVTDRRNRMRLDARAVNVETGEIEHVETVSANADDFSEMITSLAAKLNAGLRLPAMPSRSADARAARPPFQVVMLYSRGIAEENGGRKEEAVKLYRAALDRFPEYAAAMKALTRLQAGGSGT